MKKFIAILREPDGRLIEHSATDLEKHQEDWKDWLTRWGRNGNLAGGSGLTLNGCQITDHGTKTINAIHTNGTEIIGGYLLLNAPDLDHCVEIMRSCPVYGFGGYAEIRELQDQG
jgi:hypothetical protein